MATHTEKPKVFISYSWTSEKHKQWVLNFAERLCNDGVDVILDRWLLKPGQDNINFMELMVKEEGIKNVLMICDKEYQEKSDKKIGGVGIESQIISAEVYNKINQEKFIPLVRETIDGKPCLPIYLKSRFMIDISDEDKYFNNYEEILRAIYDRPGLKKPEIGTPPDNIFKDKRKSQTHIKYEIFENALRTGRENIEVYFCDFLKQLESEWINYKLYPYEDKDRAFDDAVIDSINEFNENEMLFLDALFLITKYKSDESIINCIHQFFEKSLSFAFQPKDLSRSVTTWFDNFKFLIRELFLFTMAIFIKQNFYEGYIDLTRTDYYYNNSGVNELSSFCIFDFYIVSLDQTRKNRLKSNRISIQADLIKERAEHFQGLEFEEVIQADYLLTITSIFQNEREYWYPRTLIYKGAWSQPFELFTRARNEKYFSILKKLIGFESKEEFLDKLDSSDVIRSIQQSEAFFWANTDILGLLNRENLFSG